MFGSSDFAEKIVRILDLGICYKYSRILFIQQIAYLSYILAQVVDFTIRGHERTGSILASLPPATQARILLAI